MQGAHMARNVIRRPQYGVGSYDLMQVCMNGHQITGFARVSPQFRKQHCTECGAPTITSCPSCDAEMLGHFTIPGIYANAEKPTPNNCHECGVAFPWRQQAIDAAIEALQMGLDGQDAADAVDLLPLVISDGPRVELSSFKLSRLMGKMTKPFYDVSLKVVSDVLSETAKKALGLKP